MWIHDTQITCPMWPQYWLQGRDLKMTWAHLKHKIHFMHYYTIVVKRSYHHPVFLMEDWSIANWLMVIKRHTSKVKPLSIKTLARIIPLHSTVMCRDLIWSVPSSTSLSYMEMMMLVANTCMTICSSS